MSIELLALSFETNPTSTISISKMNIFLRNQQYCTDQIQQIIRLPFYIHIKVKLLKARDKTLVVNGRGIGCTRRGRNRIRGDTADKLCPNSFDLVWLKDYMGRSQITSRFDWSATSLGRKSTLRSHREKIFKDSPLWKVAT